MKFYLKGIEIKRFAFKKKQNLLQVLNIINHDNAEI